MAGWFSKYSHQGLSGFVTTAFSRLVIEADSRQRFVRSVGPLDHMTVEEAESYLREYNRYMMQILNIHEAIPGLSEEQGLALLMGDAFQQRAEAEGKWRRATLSQVQLSSYFAGFTEIFALREQLKKQKGDKFNLRQFHDEFLSFGSAPVKVIRQLMTDNKKES